MKLLELSYLQVIEQRDEARAEAVRLREFCERAASIIQHVGYTSVEYGDVIDKAERWKSDWEKAERESNPKRIQSTELPTGPQIPWLGDKAN